MDFLGPVLAVVVVSVVMGLLSRSGHDTPMVVDGNQELRFPVGVFAIGVVAIVISLALAIVVPLTLGEPEEGRGAYIGMVTGFAALGTLLVFLQIRYRIRWDGGVIRHTPLFGGERVIAWDEVQTVHYGYISQELSVSDGSTRIKVGRTMRGFFAFVDTVETRLPPEMTAEPIEKLRKREAAR